MAESRKFIVYLENRLAEQTAEIDRLRMALEYVACCETEYPNATVKRMARVARAHLEHPSVSETEKS